MEETNTIKGIEVIAYKGMKSDMSCKGFQYEIGRSYKTDKVELCECGFHACLNPIDVLEYYSQSIKSRYFKVKLSGEITKCDFEDTKVAATEITILEEITNTFNEVINTTEWWKNDNVLDLLYWSDGFAVVRRSDRKYNYIDKQGKLLSEQWFNWVGIFQDGFARVRISDKQYNFINKNGKFLSAEWFEWTGDFYDGFARVQRTNGEMNFIDTKGNILLDEWFKWIDDFKDGFARVQRTNGEVNFIDTKGKILSDEWFKWADDFQDGFARVQRSDGLWNYIDTKGKILSDEWFNYVYYFHTDFAKVKISDNLYNFINKQGKILSDEWFIDACYLDDGLTVVKRANGDWCIFTKNGIIVEIFKKTEIKMEETIKQVEDIDTLKELNKNLISENERLAKKNVKLSEKYQSTNKKNASLRTAIASIKGFENAEQLCAELNRLKQQNKSLSEANAKLIADAKVYLKTIDEQKKVISASEKSIGTINDKLKIITLSQQSMHQALKDSGEEKSELVKKYKEALSAKSVAEARQEELEKENIQLKDENIQLRENMINVYDKASLIQRIKYVFTKSI